MREQDANSICQLGYYSGNLSGNSSCSSSGGSDGSPSEDHSNLHSNSTTDAFPFTDHPLPCRHLRSLVSTDMQGISCIVVDIRFDAELVLSRCRDISTKIPLIVLASTNQTFDDAYPYGAYVSDVTTIKEYGTAVFKQRVKQAIEHYRVPISSKDVNSPVYAVFQAIANRASEWIFLKDLDHRFIVAGENFANVAGVQLSDIIGRDDLEIGNVEDEVVGSLVQGKRGFWSRDDDVTTTGISTVEYNPEWRLYSSDARHRRTYRVALKNPADEIFGLLVCSRDVTEQVHNSQLLSERTMMLKQVMDEKARADLNRQIAEDAVDAKTRFMATASHDLRQPLHAIGLFLDSLEKRVAGTAEHPLVHQIQQSCASLNALVAGCLDVSRLDAGADQRHMEHLSAANFLSNFTEEFRHLATEKSLEYNLIVDDSVCYSDQDLLSRVVRNLYVNALQNTQSGFITIKCHQQGANIQLRVKDSGCGIAADELDHVFQEFHQIDAAKSRQERGVGLGLSIVKRLSDLLDIGVELESEPGKGSCFVLTIPQGCAEKVQFQPIEERASVPDNLRVLIIEDDPYVLHGMEVFLESCGCQLLCANDLQSAIALLDERGSLPDIIVADYHLGGDSTGIDAIQACREKIGAQLPALLVTGDTSSDSARDAALHHLPVLHKPVNTDELLAMINDEVCQSPVKPTTRRVPENSVL